MSDNNNKIDKSSLDNNVAPSENTNTAQKKSRLSFSPLQLAAWFFAALILISLAGGYTLWDFVTNTKDNIDQNISNNKIEVSALSESLVNSEAKLQNQIATLTTLQTELSNSVEALLSKSSHMRKDWLVSEAHYLVKLAVNRLTLESDVQTAITALSNADARLLEAGDPGLLVLRQEISNNLIALKTLPSIDISGISIQISSIIKQLDKLPLVTPDPESIKNSHEEIKQQNTQKTATNWQEITSKVVTDLTSLIRIRKHDQIIKPLLTPDQRFFLTQNLKLQLEQARTALLHQQEQLFRERLKQSIFWVQEYFDSSKTATQSTLKILTDLNKIKLVQEMPDLSYTLDLFTKFQSGIRLKSKPAPKKINTTKTSPKKKTTTKKSKKTNNNKTISSTPVQEPKTQDTEKKPIDNTKEKIETPLNKIIDEKPTDKNSIPVQPGISL